MEFQLGNQASLPLLIKMLMNKKRNIANKSIQLPYISTQFLGISENGFF